MQIQLRGGPFLCVLFVSLMIANQIHAADRGQTEAVTENQDETVEFDAFVIEAIAPDAEPAQNLQGRDLRIQSSATLGKTLERELGVSNLSYGPGVGQPVIRGLSGPRVRIMQNGIGAHDLSVLSPDLAIAFDTLLADNVKVMRGPATLRYGGNAMGGLVDIDHQRIPKKIPEQGYEGRITTGYDSNSSDKSGMLGVTLGKAQWALHADYFRRSSNNTHIPGAALDEDAIRQQFQVETSINSTDVIENSHSDSQGGSVGVAYIADQGRIGASYHEMAREYGIPPGVPGHADADSVESDAIRIDMSQRRYDMEAEWETGWQSVSSVQAKLSYIDYAHKDFDLNQADSLNSLTEFENAVWESRFEIQHHLGDWLDGQVGMQWQDRSFSVTGVETFTPASKVESFGFFATETMYLNDDLSLELGARVEHQSTRPQQNGINLSGVSAPVSLPNELSFLTYSVAAGIKYAFLPNTSFYLNWQRTQRAPDIQELFASGPHFATRSFEIGRLDLDAEQTSHFELGLQFAAEQFSFNLNGYFKRIKDFIYQQNQAVFFNLAPDPPRFQTNCADLRNCLPVFAYQADTADFTGYEAEISVYPDVDLPLQPHVRIFSDYVRGWFEDSTLGDVPRLPPLRFGVESGFEWAEWQAELRYTQALAQTRPGELETSTPGYYRLDMDISYDWQLAENRNMLFFIKFTNLTNQVIRNSTSFLRNFAPEAGFSTVAGINATF